MSFIHFLLRPLIGGILFVAGVVLFIVPIPVGWFVLGLSAVFLSPYIPYMKRLIAWLERKDPTKTKVLYRFRCCMDRWFPHKRVRQPEQPSDTV